MNQPNNRVLRGGPFRGLGGVAVSAACAAYFLWLLSTRSHLTGSGIAQIPAGVMAALSGTVTLLAFVRMLPSGRMLEIGSDGLRITRWPRRWQYRWADVREFSVVRLWGRDLVGYNFEPTYAERSKQRARLRKTLGVEALLPESYRFSAKDLAALLNCELAARTGVAARASAAVNDTNTRGLGRTPIAGPLALLVGFLLGLVVPFCVYLYLRSGAK